MDILIFLIMVLAWFGVVCFRRFHQYSQKQVPVKNTATLIGYWGSYERHCDQCAELINQSHTIESVELRKRILNRLS